MRKRKAPMALHPSSWRYARGLRSLFEPIANAIAPARSAKQTFKVQCPTKEYSWPSHKQTMITSIKQIDSKRMGYWKLVTGPGLERTACAHCLSLVFVGAIASNSFSRQMERFAHTLSDTAVAGIMMNS